MLQANLSSISFLSFSGYWAFLYCVAIFSNTKFCQFSAAAPASGSTRHHLHPCQLAQHAGCEDPKPTSSPPNPPDQLKFGEADTLLILINPYQTFLKRMCWQQPTAQNRHNAPDNKDGMLWETEIARVKTLKDLGSTLQGEQPSQLFEQNERSIGKTKKSRWPHQIPAVGPSLPAAPLDQDTSRHQTLLSLPITAYHCYPIVFHGTLWHSRNPVLTSVSFDFNKMRNWGI